MTCSRGEVDEERLIAHERFLLAHPSDRLVRHVVGEVITFFSRLRRFDRRGALVNRRVPLVSLTSDEAVKVFEAATTRRPLVEWPKRTGFPNRHFVALAELRRRVTVQLERHRQRRFVFRKNRSVTRRRCRDLTNAAHID